MEKITPRFIQIHTFNAYTGSLLNRDDTNMSKRMRFGGASRTRVSSQSLKRHWRTAQDEYAIHNVPGAVDAVRSRRVIDRQVVPALVEAGAVDDEWISEVVKAFNVGLYGEKGAAVSGRQPLLLGRPEVNFLQQCALEIHAAHPGDVVAAVAAVVDLFSANRGQGQNFRAFREMCRLAGGLESAMFGRMVTSDSAANIDAAIHVAHSFTVHAEESESDYFSVVDDLQDDEEDRGAAHIGDSEINSSIFYGYTVIDIPALVSNIEGCAAEEWLKADRNLAASLVGNLMHLIATVSPGAKVGSTAPYGRSHLMLAEVGSTQPRSLANAFRRPTEPQVDSAIEALSSHLSDFDEAYGVTEARRMMAVGPHDLPGCTRLNLENLCLWTAGVVRDGEVK